MKTKTLVIALALCSWLAATPASAQLSLVGSTFSACNPATYPTVCGTVRGTAVAYDPRNGVYLVVSAHGIVFGRFVRADGAVLGDAFMLQEIPEFGQFPQVAYSPDANGGNGAFLVTWLESDTTVGTSLHTRLVSYTSGLIGPDRLTIASDTFWEIMGAPVAYSTGSREFLVVWRQYSDTNIFGLRLSNAGEPVGSVIPVATTPLFESDPALTYNPATNEFFVVYRQGLGVVSALGQRIQAGTGQLVGGPSLLGQSSDIRTTGVTYNASTGQYLTAWHQMPPTNAVMGRVVSGEGTPIGNVIPLSATVGTYDSLSVDYNEASGTSLLVGHYSNEAGGVEIGGAGVPIGAAMPVTGAGGNGNFYPKVTSNTARRDWLVVAANQFSRTVAQLVTTASNGGSGPPPPPPPPPQCTYTINDSSASIGGGEFLGTVLLTTASGCSWTAASQGSWIWISKESGSGGATVQWKAQPNHTGSARVGTLLIAGKTLIVYQAPLVIQRFADFNADSFMDIVWQNQSSGSLAVWRMNGFHFVSGESFTPAVVADTGWKIVAAIDIDRNGSTDLLWQHDQGWVAVWRMDGERLVSGELITQSPLSDLGWRIVGTGDFDRDGWTDFLWQHTGNGTVAVWYMHGTTYRSGQVIVEPLSDQNWRIVGSADMNGDNNNDIVWHHGVTGQVSIWVMSGTQLVDGFLVNDSAPDLNWRIRGLGDFDGDADVDILWQNHSTGALAAWVMRGQLVDHGLMLHQSVPDTNWKIVAPR